MDTVKIRHRKGLVAGLAAVLAIGTIAMLGATFVLDDGEGEGDQPRRSIVVAAATRSATPAPDDTAVAPAVLEEDPAAEPTSPPEDTGEAPQVQPEATIDQGAPAPTQTPVTPAATAEAVTPVATPTAPAPSPTPGSCQNCPTPTLGMAPSNGPAVMVIDFWPPKFKGAVKHTTCVLGGNTHVVLTLAEEADAWIVWTVDGATTTSEIKHGSFVAFDLGDAYPDADVVAHAKDAAGNEATIVPAQSPPCP